MPRSMIRIIQEGVLSLLKIKLVLSAKYKTMEEAFLEPCLLD